MKKFSIMFLVILLNINLANAQTNLDLHIYNNTEKAFTFNVPSPITVAAKGSANIAVGFQKRNHYHVYTITAPGIKANDLRLDVYGPSANGTATEYRKSDDINLWGDRATSNSAQYASRSWDFRWAHAGFEAHAFISYQGAQTWPNLDTISINSKNDGQSYYYNSQASPNPWHHHTHEFKTFGALNSIYNKKTGIKGAAGAIQGYMAWNAGDVSFTWYKAGAGFTPLGQANKGDTTGYDIIINALPANQTKFGEAYIFGDSLSGNHIVFDASYGNIPKGAFNDGRWTNGLNWVDQLQKATGLPVLDFAFGDADIVNMVIENKVKVEDTTLAGSSGMPRVPSLEQEIFASRTKKSNLNITTNFNGNIHATATTSTTTADLFKGRSAYRYIAAGLSHCKKIAILVLMGANDFWRHFHANNPADSAVENFAGTSAQTEVGDLTQINLNLMSIASQVKYPIPECKGKLNLPQIYVLGLPNIGLAPSYNNAPEAQNFSIYLNNGLRAAIRNYDLANPNYNNLHFIPLYDFVQAIAANPTLFGYSTESISDPRDASIFGTWSTDYPTHANDFNFMGAQGDIQRGHMHRLAAHADINILPPLAYRQADINKFIFAGKMHPSAKTHALLSYDIDYWLMQNGFFRDKVDPKDPTDPANYTSQILKWVAENQGMTAKHNAAAFNALLNLANQASQPRPSFTSHVTVTLSDPVTLAPNINGPAALSSSGKQVVAMWVVDQQGVKTLYSQGGQLNIPSGTVTWLGKPTLVAKGVFQPSVAIIPGSTHMVAVWATKDGSIAYADGNNGNFWHVASKLPFPNAQTNSTSPSISIDKNGKVLLSWVTNGNADFVTGKVIYKGKSVQWNNASYTAQGGNIIAISSAILPGDKLVEFWTDHHYHLFYRFGILSASKIDWNGKVTEVTQTETLMDVAEPKVKWIGKENGQLLLANMWHDGTDNQIGLNYATVTGTGTDT